MNANELADEFENRESHWKLINYIHWAEQAETMLRQQAKEIETLNNAVDSLVLNNVLWELTDEEIALQKLSDISQEIERA